MKLPKSYIKKYGGINKKAWRAFKKKTLNKTTRKRAKLNRGTKTMARKKRRSYRRRKKNNGGLKLGALAKPLGAAAYGFIREPINDKIANSAIGRQLPASQFTDEGALILAMFAARKMGLTKNPIVGAIVRNGEAIEWGRVGRTLYDMQNNKARSPTGQTVMPTMSATVL